MEKIIKDIEQMIERTKSQIELLTERRKVYQKAIDNDLERLHEDLHEQTKLLKEVKNEQRDN